MICLKCWKEIQGDVAVYTKPCKHVFCKPCADKAFSEQSACPKCDNLLPRKDGIVQINLRPSEQQLACVASKTFGFEPKHMCQVLQAGLDFWVHQKNNDSLKHVNEAHAMKQKLDGANKEHAKILKTLDEERLKKNTLQTENDSLKGLVSELEIKYAEKARAMRKLKELYTELRDVHKRLETDLQGARNHNYDNYDKEEFNLDRLKATSTHDIQTGPMESRNRVDLHSNDSGWRMRDGDHDKQESIRLNATGAGLPSVANVTPNYKQTSNDDHAHSQGRRVLRDITHHRHNHNHAIRLASTSPAGARAVNLGGDTGARGKRNSRNDVEIDRGTGRVRERENYRDMNGRDRDREKQSEIRQASTPVEDEIQPRPNNMARRRSIPPSHAPSPPASRIQKAAEPIFEFATSDRDKDNERDIHRHETYSSRRNQTHRNSLERLTDNFNDSRHPFLRPPRGKR